MVGHQCETSRWFLIPLVLALKAGCAWVFLLALRADRRHVKAHGSGTRSNINDAPHATGADTHAQG